MNIPKVLQSSKSPESVSVTFIGAITLIAIMAIQQLGIDMSANEITTIIELLGVVIGGIMTLAGAFRKLYYRFGLDK